MNNKTSHAINQRHEKHANINGRLEIDTKTDEGTSLVLQTKVVFPSNLPLKVMHPNSPHEARNASTSRYHNSQVMREPTPTSNTIGVVFGTHFLLGP